MPTLSKERLIGFDARKMWLDPAELWSKERRDQFLLRRDANPILATDEFVWPSVFGTHQMPLASDSELGALGLLGPERPRWIGPNLPLWEDLDRLRVYLADKEADIRRPYWLVAITCIVPPERVSQLTYGPYLEETHPNRNDESWRFLGYDVSDGSLLSGLTNCGYTAADRKKPGVAYWSAALNLHHLFESRETAEKFSEFSDARVIEHAPFLVYGLYLIEEVNAG